MKAKIPELDGVRGLAILLVLLCHNSFWEPFVRAQSVLFHGNIGVDLFFVLSGFLITGILLDSKQRDAAIRNFYLRRILRIWPVYFVALFGIFLLLGRLLPAAISPWRYVFFVQNLSPDQGDGPLLHPFWSLAVEEQFYLLWPWIVLRLSLKGLARLCAALFVSALLFRIGLTLLGVSHDIVYVNTLCRTDAIALGSLLAVWVRSNESLPRVKVRYAAILAAALVATLAAAETTVFRQFANSFAAMLFASLVFQAWHQRGTGALLARILRNRVLTYIGQISFTLYVINLPIYGLAHGHTCESFFGAARHPVLADTICMIVGNCVLLLIAACSWKFFEKPILGLKDRLAHPKLVPSFAPAGD